MFMGIHSFANHTCTSFQNENVQRAATSHRVYLNARRPDRQAPSRVFTPKTFNFVEHIWEAYVHLNKQCTKYVVCEHV